MTTLRPEADASPRGPVRRGHWVLLDSDKAELVVRAPAVGQPHLVVPLTDGRSLVTVVKPGARLTIGRDAHADLPLSWDGTVSSTHAVIERHLDLVTVEDLGPSRNGTYVNDVKITTRTRLQDRDIIACAGTEILVRCPVVEPLKATAVLPPRVDWTLLSPTERRVVRTLLELWPPEMRLQRAPTTAVLAETLGLGESTVKSHLHSVYGKLAAYGIPAGRTALAEVASRDERALAGDGND